jgi:hypothetical protein
MNKSTILSRIAGGSLPLCRLVLITMLPAAAAHAIDFGIADIEGKLDITLSVGGMYRVVSPSRDLIGIANGGSQFSVNADDGNLNYGKGWVSAPAAITADLDLRRGDLGGFFRINAFYDYINNERDRERTPLTKDARDRVGRRFDMLDAYLWYNLRPGGAPLNIRLGRQVLNWGESTFIPNGISSINPVDVSKLRIPGAELREAYLPVWMASLSYGITDNITLEGFYQFKWKEVIIDPPGTYFSTNDFAGRGGERVYLGFGNETISDLGPFGAIPRGPNNEPKDSGQFGLAARIFTPNLNQSEFGLYFLHYHSRLPVISARTPTSGISPALVQATASSLAQANLVPAMLINGVPPDVIASVLPQLLGAALTNVPVGSLPPTLAPFAPFYEGAEKIAAGARQVGFLSSAAEGRYLIEYPENIKLVGASFNTDLGMTGISLQGEISFRWDQPLQVDDVELLFAALSSINPAYGGINQLGNYAGQLDTYVRGYVREEVWQAQVTATKLFGPMLGAQQLVLLCEVGMTYVPGLPDKQVLRFDGPGTFLGGNPIATAGGAQPGTEPLHGFADRQSWGYRVVSRLDYTNVLFSMNLSPMVQFAHDVSGNTPLPLGNFVHGRKSVTLGVEATYQNSWAMIVNYTNYFGAGRYNLIHDRDFVSATIKYSF